MTRWLLLCSMLCVLGCRRDDGTSPGPLDTDTDADTDTATVATGPSGDTATGASPLVHDAAVQVSEVVPTVFRGTFTTDVPGRGHLELSLDGVEWLPTESTPEGSTEHQVRVLGLKAGRTYRWRPVLEGDDGSRHTGAEQQLTTGDVPADFPPITLEGVDPAGLVHERFFVLFSIVGYPSSYAIVVDHDGDPVWWVPSPVPQFNVTIAQPSIDGQAVMHALLNVDHPSNGVTRTPFGVMTESERSFTRTPVGHHAFVEHDDGTLTYLAHEYTEIGPYDEHDQVRIQTSSLVSVPLGTVDGAEAQRLFSVIDDTDLVGDGATCSHNEARLHQGLMQVEYGHANSLVYLEDRDTYAINFRNLDRVLEVDRSDGAVRWQIGGLESDFSIDVLPARFEHGHFTQMWPTGLAMFSNELHSGGSRVLVYDLDPVQQSLTTAWLYAEPTGATVGVLGDVDLIGPRAALVSWATQSTMQIIVSERGPAWTVRVDDATVGRAAYTTDLYDFGADTLP
jgi:hypothetical protein